MPPADLGVAVILTPRVSDFHVFVPPTDDQKGLIAVLAIRPLTCTYLVAGAGFEPATSGL